MAVDAHHMEMELLFHTYILIETKTQQHSPQARTISTSERNYAQLKKEAFSLVYSVQHLHRYLYGMCFTLVTDHKPLTMILTPCKDIPSSAAVRLQQWAIILSAYQYQIECKCTNDDGNADGLSRLPIFYWRSPGNTQANSWGPWCSYCRAAWKKH